MEAIRDAMRPPTTARPVAGTASSLSRARMRSTANRHPISSATASRRSVARARGPRLTEPFIGKENRESGRGVGRADVGRYWEIAGVAGGVNNKTSIDYKNNKITK